MRSLGLHAFCRQGELGLYACPSGRIIVVCDECETVYLDPRAYSEGRIAADAETSFSRLPECYGGHDATDEELRAAGLDDLGESVVAG